MKLIKKVILLFLLVVVIACGGKQTKFIELERFTSESNGQFSFRVLICNPPLNKDSLKSEMLQFYREKNSYLKTLDASYFIGSISFYEKTRCTSFFIENDEDHTGFFTDALDDCNDMLGFIGVHDSLDSRECMDWMSLYEKTSEGDISRISMDTLFYKCNGKYINNWNKW